MGRVSGALIVENVKLGTSFNRTVRLPDPRATALLTLLLALLAAGPAFAQPVRLDAFVGFGDMGNGGVVTEASWFPIVCEIKNDGPTFTGTIEISPANFGQGQNQRVVVELPTGTLKRLSIPVFAAGRYQRGWDLRLFDERHRLRAPEHLNAGASVVLPSGSILLGALPRNMSGTPVIREITAKASQQDFKPTVARFPEAPLVPDNPLVWEGMTALYLSSEKATGLKDTQVEALEAWLNNGGHLIIAVDAAGDVNGTPWLHSLVPMDLVAGSRPLPEHRSLQQWLRASYSANSSSAAVRFQSGAASSGNYNNNPFASLPDDADFENAELAVVTGTLREGTASIAEGNVPLMVTSAQGRGTVTVLLFDPERDPFRSWKNLPSFWAKLAGVPPELYLNEVATTRGTYGIDAVFGAMIDSKQIRKLPVEWLLLLLVAYLAVIGPLDQYWLKRIKRPMLTWLTFPCYVVLFSVMIYLIGYKLRAGETEWNELNLVDVLPRGDTVEMRGHSFFSIYSPVNETYRVQSQMACAAFRGEFRGSWGGAGQAERAEVRQEGNNFTADLSVPVWTSQLYAGDWWEPADKPIQAEVTSDSRGLVVVVRNHQSQPLSPAYLAVGGYIYTLGAIPAGATQTNHFGYGQGQALGVFVTGHANSFQSVIMSRQQSFGNTANAQISDVSNACVAVSLLGAQSMSPANAANNPGGFNLNNFGFVLPPGLDLTPAEGRGEAVLLAWESNFSPVKPINQFPTRRSHKDTLWRLVLPTTSKPAN